MKIVRSRKLRSSIDRLLVLLWPLPPKERWLESLLKSVRAFPAAGQVERAKCSFPLFSGLAHDKQSWKNPGLCFLPLRMAAIPSLGQPKRQPKESVSAVSSSVHRSFHVSHCDDDKSSHHCKKIGASPCRQREGQVKRMWRARITPPPPRFPKVSRLHLLLFSLVGETETRFISFSPLASHGKTKKASVKGAELSDRSGERS